MRTRETVANFAPAAGVEAQQKQHQTMQQQQPRLAASLIMCVRVCVCVCVQLTLATQFQLDSQCKHFATFKSPFAISNGSGSFVPLVVCPLPRLQIVCATSKALPVQQLEKA